MNPVQRDVNRDTHPILRVLADLIGTGETPRMEAVPAPGQRTEFVLTIWEAGRPQQRVLNSDVYFVGRDQCNFISMADDKFMSKKHAVIAKIGDHFAIEDLTSRNGTYVNGKRIDERVVLKPGDRIIVGRTIMEVSLRAAKSSGKRDCA